MAATVAGAEFDFSFWVMSRRFNPDFTGTTECQQIEQFNQCKSMWCVHRRCVGRYLKPIFSEILIAVVAQIL
jgi:hypothetical protein